MNRAVVYTVDNNTECLLQMVASIRSVRRFLGDIDVFILTNTPRPWMNDIYGAKVVDVSRLVSEYKLNNTGIVWRAKLVSPMLLFRLLIPLVGELSGYDQILYLDTDTEIWSDKFSRIFEFDPKLEFDAVAVRDPLKPSGTFKRIKALKDKNPRNVGLFTRWDELLGLNYEYVNSGLIVFNMPTVSVGYAERVKKVIDCMKFLRPKYPDQDVLNIYYRLKVVNDMRFNHWVGDFDEVYLKHYVGNIRRRYNQYPVWSNERPNATLDRTDSNSKLGILSGKVDHVYVITDCDKENINVFLSRLSDIGVEDFTEFDARDTPEARALLNKVPHDNVRPEHMGNWLCHYKAIVDASEHGYEKIAVFEDMFDLRCLPDAVIHLPCDWDIALSSGKGIFMKSDAFQAKSSKGYFIGKAGMVGLRKIFESLWDVSNKNRFLRYVHKWLSNKALPKARAYVMM